MKKIFLVILIMYGHTIHSQMTPERLLDVVDKTQRNYDTMKFSAQMFIKSGSRELSKEFGGYIQSIKEAENSFMEYTNPQDRGTKYLKLNQDLWIYFPDAQDVLKISGHLLRDSMMGSDISYDDMLDRSAYSFKYKAESLSSTNFEGSDMYILTLRAKDNSVSYIRQDMFVDKKNNRIRKVIMYAKGRKEDRPIKEFEMDNYQTLQGVAIATELKVRDLRKKNSQTTIVYGAIEINPTINPTIFTRINLER